MNGKTARALRRYTNAQPYDDVINRRQYRRIKREWTALSHKERGRLRALASASATKESR